METIFDYNPAREELARFFDKEQVDRIQEFKDKVYVNEDDDNYALGIIFHEK